MPEFLDNNPGLLVRRRDAVAVVVLRPDSPFVRVQDIFPQEYTDGSTGNAILQLLGGPAPGRIAAFVATGAIGLAFVLSITGFVIFVSGHEGHERESLKTEEAIRDLRHDRHHAEAKRDKLAHAIDDLEMKLAGTGNTADAIKKFKRS